MLNDSLIIEKNFIKINKEFGLMRNRSIDDEIKKKVQILIKNMSIKKNGKAWIYKQVSERHEAIIKYDELKILSKYLKKKYMQDILNKNQYDRSSI